MIKSNCTFPVMSEVLNSRQSHQSSHDDWSEYEAEPPCLRLPGRSEAVELTTEVEREKPKTREHP